MKKERVAHFNSTACYLKKEDKVLMIKFSKKWRTSICATRRKA